eukprot:Gb_38408 [translate_table: standard]
MLGHYCMKSSPEIHLDLARMALSLVEVTAEVEDIHSLPYGELSIATKDFKEEQLLGKATSSTDVFRFDILLLEVASGRKPKDQSKDEEEVVLVDWVWDLYMKEKLMHAVDLKLRGEFDVEEMQMILHLCLISSHPEPKSRLTIRKVLQILEDKMSLLPYGIGRRKCSVTRVWIQPGDGREKYLEDPPDEEENPNKELKEGEENNPQGEETDEELDNNYEYERVDENYEAKEGSKEEDDSEYEDLEEELVMDDNYPLDDKEGGVTLEEELFKEEHIHTGNSDYDKTYQKEDYEEENNTECEEVVKNYRHREPIQDDNSKRENVNKEPFIEDNNHYHKKECNEDDVHAICVEYTNHKRKEKNLEYEDKGKNYYHKEDYNDFCENKGYDMHIKNLGPYDKPKDTINKDVWDPFPIVLPT